MVSRGFAGLSGSLIQVKHPGTDRSQKSDIQFDVWNHNMLRTRNTHHTFVVIYSSSDMRNLIHPTTSTAKNSTVTTSTTMNVSRYRRRDTHEVFFRPRLNTSRHQIQTRRQKTNQSTIDHWTQWVRDHHELHHEIPTISGYHHF